MGSMEDLSIGSLLVKQIEKKDILTKVHVTKEQYL